MNEQQFQIALSFSGEDRAYVARVASALESAGVLVFYDAFEEANLWGKNLYDYLTDLYSTKALQTVMFISQHYAKKMWPTLERQSMQARALRDREEYILPVRFDDTEVPGLLPTIGYLSVENRTPESLAQAIIQKLEASSSTKLLANARLLLEKLRWGGACKFLDLYVVKEPLDSEGHFLRGIAHANLDGGLEHDVIACKSYALSVELAPSNLDSNRLARRLTYHAAMLKRIGHLEEAESTLLRAEPLASNYYEAHDIKYNLACVYALQNRRENLLEMVKQLSSARPELARIRKHLDDYFANFKDDAEFLVAIEQPPERP